VSGRPVSLVEDGGGLTRLERLGDDALLGLLAGRRWFADAQRGPQSARVSRVVHGDDDLELALVDVQLAGGESSTYVVAVGPDGEDATEQLPALARLVALAGAETPCLTARASGVEQSNTSVVLDESVVLKLYRRLEAGPSPEVELLRALEAAGFAAAPKLRGVIELTGAPFESTVAVFTDYVPSAGGGWELTLASLAEGNAGWLPTRASRLGEVTGAMHAALATSTDPRIAPKAADRDAIGRLTAALDEEVVRLASVQALPEVSRLAGRLDGLRDLIRDLGRAAPPELVVRVHGDYHLGQVLWADTEDWVVIDFEGEPGRTLTERRRRAFAFRDVAGMLRSFAYVADASSLLGGPPAPAGWEASCRAAFVAGWRATVDPRLLPASELDLERLLVLCELRKLLYELRYELAHRPDWVGIPVSGLERILEAT